jgi:D-serine deaminase-like pyridoxal phosphate-dependent protein
MDRALKNQASYIGKPASELPTPALLISLPVLKRNIDRLYAHVDATGVGFRPHVKTLKVSATPSHTRHIPLTSLIAEARLSKQLV